MRLREAAKPYRSTCISVAKHFPHEETAAIGFTRKQTTKYQLNTIDGSRLPYLQRATFLRVLKWFLTWSPRIRHKKKKTTHLNTHYSHRGKTTPDWGFCRKTGTHTHNVQYPPARLCPNRSFILILCICDHTPLNVAYYLLFERHWDFITWVLLRGHSKHI